MKVQLYFSVVFNTFNVGCLTELIYYLSCLALGKFWSWTVMETYFVMQSDWLITLAGGWHVVIIDTAEAFG